MLLFLDFTKLLFLLKEIPQLLFKKKNKETLDVVLNYDHFLSFFGTKSKPVILHRFTKIEERLYSYPSKQRNGIITNGY